jgi:hypothetical protein
MMDAHRRMHLKTYIIAVVVSVLALLLPGCKSGEGPLLINSSGQSARLVVHAVDGSRYEGVCEDQAAVWAGRARSVVARIEVFVGATRYELSGEELTVPYGKDVTTAFIIEKGRPRKLALDEARILMRAR